MYVLSSVITVPSPEPTTLTLLGSAMLVAGAWAYCAAGEGWQWLADSVGDGAIIGLHRGRANLVIAGIAGDAGRRFSPLFLKR